MKKIILFIFVFSVTKLTFCQWTNLTSGTNQYLTSIQFVNDSIGYCSSENGLLLKTTNEGLNWNIAGNFLGQKALFIDADTGFSYYAYDLFLPSYDIFKSTDGGTSWTSKLSSEAGFFS